MYVFAGICILWVMFRFGMWRSVLFILSTAMALAILFFSFALGAIITFMFTPEVIQKWYLLPSWVDAWLNSHQTLGPMMLIPLIFIIDCIRWMVHLTLFQSSWIMWVTVGVSLLFALNVYVAMLGVILSEEQVAIMRNWLKNTPQPPAKPARRNGYNEHGHFVGYDYDPNVGNIKNSAR